MFARKKDAANVSDKYPVFHVRYLGCTETFVANGTGCSYAPVQRLWDNAPDEKRLRRVTLKLGPKGITLSDTEKKDELIKHFPIADISFCNAEKAINERIFSWICRNDEESHLDCHAVLCSTTLKAQTMAVVLSRAFQIAYKDWKSQMRQREMARTSAEQKTVAAAPQQNGSSGEKFTKVRKYSQNGSASSQTVSKTTSHAVSTKRVEGTSDIAGPSHKNNNGFAETSSGFTSDCILDPDLEDDLAKVHDLKAALDSDDNESD